jgi:hypothetical protein
MSDGGTRRFLWPWRGALRNRGSIAHGLGLLPLGFGNHIAVRCQRSCNWSRKENPGVADKPPGLFNFRPLSWRLRDQKRGARAGLSLPGAPGITRGCIGSRPSRCIFLRASLRARRTALRKSARVRLHPLKALRDPLKALRDVNRRTCLTIPRTVLIYILRFVQIACSRQAPARRLNRLAPQNRERLLRGLYLSTYKKFAVGADRPPARRRACVAVR